MDIKELAASFSERNPFTNGLGIEVTAIEPDYAEGRIEFAKKISNRSGFVHGGVYMSLADTIASAAVHSRGASYVTQSCSFQFYKATKDETLCCAARVNHRGRKTCVAETKLTHADGTLVGEGLFSFYKVSDEAVK
ncbi:MAG TPA: PaaI family thioesterase [Clostridiales bacterium]|jgi:acyl-CoA thioesterase|nr:PaaI family thioesterase [Clostridiales bacterium]